MDFGVDFGVDFGRIFLAVDFPKKIRMFIHRRGGFLCRIFVPDFSASDFAFKF